MNLFASEQADLNWANPRARKEMADITNFWLDRDVDGFRMDVINLISKAPAYPSIPAGARPQGYFIDGPQALGWIPGVSKQAPRKRRRPTRCESAVAVAALSLLLRGTPIVAFRRHADGKSLLVLINFSSQPSPLLPSEALELGGVLPTPSFDTQEVYDAGTLQPWAVGVL